jgi:hypothetical protein
MPKDNAFRQMNLLTFLSPGLFNVALSAGTMFHQAAVRGTQTNDGLERI